jgi:hypothetical protein
VFWLMVYGPRAGDKEFLKLIGPDSEILAEQTNVAPNNQAQKLIYMGRCRCQAWRPGIYTGVYTLPRGRVGSEETVVEVERVVQIR